MKKLIAEIHRRSLWQVLGIYGAGSWVSLQIVDTLTSSLELPGWVQPFAVVLLVLGFPVVMATAFVQEGLGSRTPDGREDSAANGGEPPGGGAPPLPSGTGPAAEAEGLAGRADAPAAPARRAPTGAAGLFTWRNAIAGGVVALALWGLVALGWMFFVGAPPRVESASAATSPVEALLPRGDERGRSIAVLPFANLSPDPDNAFFADGVHENILTQLSRIGDLRVLSRTSMLRYRDTDKTIRQIADEVGAGAVLEGSVQRVGERLRISAQLIDPVNEEHLWADQYDGEVERIFEFQSDVARRVAAALHATLTPREAAVIDRPSTASVTALDYQLRGRQAYDRITESDNEEAIRLFRQAIAADSSFALAWAGLGDGYLQRVQFYGYPIEWADSGQAAGRRAIELDPELAEGYKTIGFAYSMRGQERTAAEWYGRAIERDPNFSNPVNNVGVSHLLLGAKAEALRWWKRSFRLDPNGSFARTNVASGYMALHEWEIAQRWIDEARALDPADYSVHRVQWLLDVGRGELDRGYERYREFAVGIEDPDPSVLATLAAAALFARDYSAAAKNAAAALARAPGGAPDEGYDVRIIRAFALSREGLNGEALELLGAAESELEARIEEGADDTFFRYNLAGIQALRGARELAIAALRRAYESGWNWGEWLDRDPVWDAYREDPRVRELTEMMMADVERQRREIETEERVEGLRPARQVH